jgi:hypothetical protein
MRMDQPHMSFESNSASMDGSVGHIAQDLRCATPRLSDKQTKRCGQCK